MCRYVVYRCADVVDPNCAEKWGRVWEYCSKCRPNSAKHCGSGEEETRWVRCSHCESKRLRTDTWRQAVAEKAQDDPSSDWSRIAEEQAAWEADAKNGQAIAPNESNSQRGASPRPAMSYGGQSSHGASRYQNASGEPSGQGNRADDYRPPSRACYDNPFNGYRSPRAKDVFSASTSTSASSYNGRGEYVQTGRPDRRLGPYDADRRTSHSVARSNSS